MVKSIQVYKYEYSPSVAAIRDKVGTKKILKRPVSALHLDNVNELKELTTTIRNLEMFENGIMGKADYQYITSVKRHTGVVYEDFNIIYNFYINKKFQLLIIGGSADHRNQFKSVLEQFFNEGTGYATPLTILRDPLLELVNKIKKDGPMKDRKYKNIMKRCNYHNANFKDHKGVKKEDVDMFDRADGQICVSETESFKRNFPDCETFDTKMRVYKCNGILLLSITEAILEMKSGAEFSFAKNPSFQGWIIFIIQTAIRFLPL